MEPGESAVTTSRPFRMFAGVVLAMPSAAACAYSLGDFERIWLGAAIGAVFGIVVGAISPSSVTGTMAGIFVAVLTALFMLVKGAGLWGMLGIIVGFFLGGMLERADDEWQRENRRIALRFCFLASLTSLLLVYGFDRAAFGPEPKRAAEMAVETVTKKWFPEQPQTELHIRSAKLTRTNRTQYSGTMLVVVNDREVELPIEVSIDRLRDVENHVSVQIDKSALEEFNSSIQSP